MNNAIRETFIKTLIFSFLSLEILLSISLYFKLDSEYLHLNQKVLYEMKLCHHSNECNNLIKEVVERDKHISSILYSDDLTIYSYHDLSTNDKRLKTSLPIAQYNKQKSKIHFLIFIDFITMSALMFLLCVIFTIFSLRTLRTSISFTHEIIRDILHDFNTPLSSLLINQRLLKKEFGNNEKIERSEKAIEMLINMQNDLKVYTSNQKLSKEEFNIKPIIEEQINLISKNFPDISYKLDITDINIVTNKNGFIRIISNLLSNASKYNKPSGYVSLTLEKNILKIKDNGKGIENPQKVFKRFYTEQQNGVGIGLHVVKKLCDSMKIDINVNSKPDKGTTFYLNLEKLTLN